MWAPAKEALREKGIDLQFVQYPDYTEPNRALAEGEIDMNAFQHRVFFESDIAAHGYELMNVGNTYIIPLSIYSEKIGSIDELKDGDTIAIPADATNRGRALKVLDAAGVITLQENARFNPVLDDIEQFNVKVELVELPAEELAGSITDVTAAFINGNYALDAGIDPTDTIYEDTSLSEEKYWNLLAARTSDMQSSERIALFDEVVKAFQSPAMQESFETRYNNYFAPAGWDDDRLAVYR